MEAYAARPLNKMVVCRCCAGCRLGQGFFSWIRCPRTDIVTPGATRGNRMAVSALRLDKLENVQIETDHGHAR